jgi:hypothetical protein
MPSSPPYYFLKISNQTRSTIQLDRVWFATAPEVAVDNDQRPLPTLLEPGELFETWTLTRQVPATPGIEHLARALLGDGSVVESQPNRNVSPAGLVGGGGQPLTLLAGSVAAINHSGDQLIEKAWDVFICHASDDKDAVVRPLVHALQERGLRVWYDEFELRLGDSLRREIDKGIARSAFGVIVLSPAFFANGWPNYELDGAGNPRRCGQGYAQSRLCWSEGVFWGWGRPRMARRRGGLARMRLMVAAILVWPAWRMRPIARLRRVAMTRGREPVRTWEASSPNVTSRTQWILFSIAQCPRT